MSCREGVCVFGEREREIRRARGREKVWGWSVSEDMGHGHKPPIPARIPLFAGQFLVGVFLAPASV